jgi:hypothetical protein
MRTSSVRAFSFGAEFTKTLPRRGGVDFLLDIGRAR